MNNTKHSDTYWILTLIGTAIGAGILFLPLQVGISGIWPFFATLIVVFPATYFSHRAYNTVLIKTKKPKDYTGAVQDFLGQNIGLFLNLLFTLALFAAVVVYSTALNNDLANYLKILTPDNNLSIGRICLSFGVLFLLISIMKSSRDFFLMVMGVSSGILTILLLTISFYLIPYWQFTAFHVVLPPLKFAASFLQVLALVIYTFFFFPALSTIVMEYRKGHDFSSPISIEKRLNKIILLATAILFVSVIFFAISCMLAMDKNSLNYALKNNISALATLGNHSSSPLLKHIEPLLGIFTLVTSFLGVMLGVRTSAHEFISKVIVRNKKLRKPWLLNSKKRDHLIMWGAFIALWIFSILNLPILTLLGIIVTPLLAIFFYVIPVIIFYKKAGFKKYRTFANNFVLVIGIILLFSFALGWLL